MSLFFAFCDQYLMLLLHPIAAVYAQEPPFIKAAHVWFPVLIPFRPGFGIHRSHIPLPGVGLNKFLAVLQILQDNHHIQPIPISNPVQ